MDCFFIPLDRINFEMLIVLITTQVEVELLESEYFKVIDCTTENLKSENVTKEIKVRFITF